MSESPTLRARLIERANYLGECAEADLMREAADALRSSSPAHGDNLRQWLQDYTERQRALIEARGKGGQHTGQSPSITPSVLRELEWMLRNSTSSPAQGWQPIESAPKDCEVLLYGPTQFGGHGIAQGAWNRGGAMHMPYWMGGIHQPTHWMPLPAPPVAAPAEGEVPNK